MRPTIDEVATTLPTDAAPSDRIRRRPRWRRVVGRTAIGGVVAVFVAVSVLVVIQDRIVYGAEQDVAPIAERLPGGEEVRYVASDGVELTGWFVPAVAPDTDYTAVVFHGIRATRDSLATYAAALADAGVSVLLAEYRGFGGVGGSPSEEGLGRDAVAAIGYARSRPGADASRLVLIGYSLGTGVAVAVAPASDPAGLVLLAPYTSLPDVAWSRFPGPPYRWLMRSTFDSLATIAAVDAPVLVVRGADDREIPPQQSFEVFDAAPNQDRMVTIAGAGHDLRGPAGPSPSEVTVAFIEGLHP